MWPRSLMVSFKALLQITLLWLLNLGVVFGQMPSATINTGAPPTWVDSTVVEPVGSLALDQQANGQALIFFDHQVNVKTSESYFRLVKEITTETGVEKGANLAFSFDPSFEKLFIHQIEIHRNGQVLNRLDTGKFKIIQQETDLDRQIYNGRLSAVLFVEDVRVGDRIEYAYSLNGQNPVWNGHYADSLMAQLSVPIQHIRHRVLWSGDHDLLCRSFAHSVTPQIHTVDGMTEYIWDIKSPPIAVVEDQMPSWFQAFGWVQVSSFTNWAEVANWATGLYANNDLDEASLKARADELHRAYATDEQTVQAALDFVQNNIRYLGIEFGPSSYHPADPATVLQRRFGDCKDKAFLLCTLLHHLGYEATPALVGTGFRHTLPDFLPSPNIFNHVIVRLVASGKTYWVDPTANYQHGPMDQRFLPKYGYALLLRPGETNLTPIPELVGGNAETLTREIFDVGSQKGTTKLSVTTTCKGFDAEWMRAVLATSGQEALAKSYLNDYAQRYPGAGRKGTMTAIEIDNQNAIELHHEYVITNFWVISSDRQRYECQFYPLGIHSWITKPSSLNRSMPMEPSYPRHRLVHTEVNLPIEFKLTSEDKVITGPAAELSVHRTSFPRKVSLEYDYKSLTNFVPVTLIPEHLKSLDEMERALGYVLTWQNMENNGGSHINWPVLLLAVFYTLGCAVAVLMLYTWHRRKQSNDAALTPPLLESSLVGLGGWLILVGLNIIIGPLRVLYGIARNSTGFSNYSWQALTTPGSVSYQPLWAPLLCFELLGQITILIISLWCMALFFQKRRGFPLWFIIMLSINTVFVVADQFAASSLVRLAHTHATDMANQQALVQGFIGCCIWIPYMRISRRVKATFTR